MQKEFKKLVTDPTDIFKLCKMPAEKFLRWNKRRYMQQLFKKYNGAMGKMAKAEVIYALIIMDKVGYEDAVNNLIAYVKGK